MKASIQSLITLAAGTAVSLPGFAADLNLKLTLPTIDTKGGRPALRPYVAIWLQKADESFVSNLSVWYQTVAKARRGGPPGGPQGEGMRGAPPEGMGPMPGGREGGPPGGARWLNEMRQWWSDSGSNIKTFPIDGVSSASRAAGEHELTFSNGKAPLNNLAPGNYRLMVEVGREHGGLESVAIPFGWPAKNVQTLTASGKTELGAVALTLKP
jgi:hypothetical protein